MPYVMFDSVNAADFPPGGFNVTAGYVAGKYPSSQPILARFPNTPHLTIAVTARQDADCLDVEPGDATPDEAPAWYDRQKARGVTKPVIYCMASWIGQVRTAMGGRDYLLWSAHYNGKPHICGTDPSCTYPKVDATQWADKGPRGENVDQSLLSDYFYSTITGGDDDMPSSKEVADAVWGHQIARAGVGPAAAEAWLADARILAETAARANPWETPLEKDGWGPAVAEHWLADIRILTSQWHDELNARLDTIEKLLTQDKPSP